MTTLHSLRQQLADAVNARDVARVREHAADARAAASETRRVAAEASAAEIAAAAALEIESLRKSLDLNQQMQLEMQQLLQRKDTEFAETLGSSAAEVVSLSATLHELQQSYRYSRAACIVFDCCLFFRSAALQQLEKFKGSSACTATHFASDSSVPSEQRISDAYSFSATAPSVSRQRYPQPSLENLLSAPSSQKASNGHPSSIVADIASESDAPQLRLHIAALELQVSTLRDALSDAQDECSLFEKQCDWFKKMELELQLSRDRNCSASDLDYLRRPVVLSSLCSVLY